MNEIAMNVLLAWAVLRSACLPLVVFVVCFLISSIATYRLFYPRRHEWTVEEILEREG
jgi:hypothetical protein